MNDIIAAEFGGSVFQFDGRGWVNATGAAASYSKRPVDWLRLPGTKRYIDALCRRNEVGFSHFVQTHRGGDLSIQGTWIHPKLAVMFARWLDIEFAIWCDEQIDSIIRGQSVQQFGIWKALQAAIARDAGSKVRASFGSHLMLERKREKPALTQEIGALTSLIQPSLLT